MTGITVGITVRIIAFFLIVFIQIPFASSQVRLPKIGYVYPAGGERGKTVEILVGGRQIARCTAVLVSGTGVHGRVLGSYTQMGIVGSDDSRVVRILYEEAKKAVETASDAATGTVLDAVKRRIVPFWGCWS